MRVYVYDNKEVGVQIMYESGPSRSVSLGTDGAMATQVKHIFDYVHDELVDKVEDSDK